MDQSTKALALILGELAKTQGEIRDALRLLGRDDQRSPSADVPLPATLPAKTILLGHGGPTNSLALSNSEIQARSKVKTKWTVLLAPGPAAIQALFGGEEWGVTAQVRTAHEDAQFTHRSDVGLELSQYIVPLAGLCLAVSAQDVRIAVNRNSPGSTQSVDLAVSVSPGTPQKSYYAETRTVSNAVPGVIPVPLLARRWRALVASGPLTSADTITAVSPDGTSLGFWTVAESISRSAPIHPLAVAYRYDTTSLTAAIWTMEYEIWS